MQAGWHKTGLQTHRTCFSERRSVSIEAQFEGELCLTPGLTMKYFMESATNDETPLNICEGIFGNQS